MSEVGAEPKVEKEEKGKKTKKAKKGAKKGAKKAESLQNTQDTEMKNLESPKKSAKKEASWAQNTDTGPEITKNSDADKQVLNTNDYTKELRANLGNKDAAISGILSYFDFT